jgi:hypothetical protein
VVTSGGFLVWNRLVGLNLIWLGFLCSEIIQLSGTEIQKLRLANWELARANAQMMAVCFSPSFPNSQQVSSPCLQLSICLVAYFSCLSF